MEKKVVIVMEWRNERVPMTEFLIIQKLSQRYSELIFTFLHLYISNGNEHGCHSVHWEMTLVLKTSSLVNVILDWEGHQL